MRRVRTFTCLLALACGLFAGLALGVAADAVGEGAAAPEGNAATATAAPTSVLLITHNGADWGAARRLHADRGMVFGAATYGDVTWELLQQFNAVIVFDMNRLDPDATQSSYATITPADHQRLGDLLERYVQAGGGLYVYGVSFMHMGQGHAALTLNAFLQRFDAQAPFEMLRDPGHEVVQTGGRQVRYALADRIVAHPATRGVEHLWYAIGPFSYGPWMRALQLGAAWTPLVFTSPDYTSQPLGKPLEHAQPEDRPSAISGERAVTYAAREFGKGRIVLNGGESTISFFNYDYSPYADAQWERIGMERGLNDIPSDGYTLLANSLAWLAEPSRGNFGGYLPPPVPQPTPRRAEPRAWASEQSVGDATWQPGLIAVIQLAALRAYADAAKARGLTWLVAAVDFETTPADAWADYVATCAAQSSDAFVLVPAVATRDHLGNHFIQAGPKSLPRPERLDTEQPTRVRDHLGYWMNDANFPLRVVYRFADSHYPAALHSGYSAFAIRTWRDGELIDAPAPAAYHDNASQGDEPMLVSVHLLSSPEALTKATDITHLRASSPAAAQTLLTSPQFSSNLSYASTGPRILNWTGAGLNRQTWGEPYVTGTERWRAILTVASEVPLKQATIQDGAQTRRYALSGKTATIQLDGLHDGRHVLTAIVEDEAGGIAYSGALATGDSMFRQGFCSDRCNIMGGQSTLRDGAGFDHSVPASAMLYKAGRLSASTVGLGESLPGIDGSGQGNVFFLNADFRVTAADPAQSEERAQVHLIRRPWESADGLVFRTPIAYRSPAPESGIYGHNPYVELAEPRINARLEQYHFYRNPMYPSPAMATFIVENREGQDVVETAKGWQGLAVRFANSWGVINRYCVVRRDGTLEPGPTEGNPTLRTRLEAGDSLYFPELGEGFFLRQGPLDIVLECVPERQWFRLWTGRTDPVSLTRESVSVVLLRVADSGDAGLAQWRSFGAAYGLTGGAAGTAGGAAGNALGYRVVPTQGSVADTRYLLQLTAAEHGFTGTFRGTLPQRLPVKIGGINPRWTAGVVSLDRPEWRAISGDPAEDAAYTTLDLSDDVEHPMYIGNLLTTDAPDLLLTLLPANADGLLYADVHNPTDQPVAATLRVPVSTWLAPAQARSVEVPPMSTRRFALIQTPEIPQ